MPADPSIYSQLRQTVQPADPLDQYGKMVSIKSLLGNEQLNEMQRTKLTRDMQEEEQFKALFAGATPEQMNAPDFLQRAIGASPQRGLALQKSMLEQQKAQADLFKTKLETGAKALELHRDQLANVNDPQAAAQWVRAAYADPLLKDIAAHGGTVDQAIARIPTDPAQFADWKRNSSAGASKLLELNQQLSGQKETARHNAATEAQAGATLTETSRHHAALEGNPQTIEETAQAIAKGQLAPLSGFALARPMAQNIMARVVQINPDYDPTRFATVQKAEKDFATGKQGNSVRSFNVALSHLDTLDQLADALNNKDTQLINKIGNAWATQTGSAAPTNFVAAKKIVADEIVKAIVGSGGGVTDREEAAKTIAAANSPAQLKGVINTYKELMRGQINGLRDQYKATTGKEDFDSKYLSEAGRQAAHAGGGAPRAPGATGATPGGAPNALQKPSGGIKFLGFE